MGNQSAANYRWFLDSLPRLLATRKGQHALLHNQTMADYYQTSLDGIKAGLIQFGEGNFSVELVDSEIEDLGFYSHVGAALRA